MLKVLWVIPCFKIDGMDDWSRKFVFRDFFVGSLVLVPWILCAELFLSAPFVCVCACIHVCMYVCMYDSPNTI